MEGFPSKGIHSKKNLAATSAFREPKWSHHAHPRSGHRAWWGNLTFCLTGTKLCDLGAFADTRTHYPTIILIKGILFGNLEGEQDIVEGACEEKLDVAICRSILLLQ